MARKLNFHEEDTQSTAPTFRSFKGLSEAPINLPFQAHVADASHNHGDLLGQLGRSQASISSSFTQAFGTIGNFFSSIFNGPPVDPIRATSFVKASGNPLIDGLLFAVKPFFDGIKWAPDAKGGYTTITYSFQEKFLPFPLGLWKSQTAFDISARAATRDVLKQLESFTNLKFVEVDERSGKAGAIRLHFADLGPNVAGEAFQPGPLTFSGNIAIDREYAYGNLPAYFAVGGYGRQVILHEIGHALGLEHSFETYDKDIIPIELDVDQNTVMSYSHSYVNPSSFMPLDIQVLQYLYGANRTASGNNYYYIANANHQETIWDPSGTDTLIYNGDRPTTFDLNPGSLNVHYSSIIVKTAYGTVIENVTGGYGADSILGAQGNNIIDGRGGGDYIESGSGNDTIYGGDGNDQLLATVNGLSNLFYNGGTGFDSLSFNYSNNNSVKGLSFVSNGTNGFTVSLLGSYGQTFLTLSGVEQLNGSNRDDLFVGLSTGLTLLDGGLGVDTFSFASAKTAQSIYANQSYHASNNGYWLLGFEKYIGSNFADTFYGAQSQDHFTGADGDDLFYGEASDDYFLGGNGNDNGRGGTGNDRLIGGNGNDTLLGDDGIDTLIGGKGQDKLSGGSGSDVFVFTDLGSGNLDIVTDFQTGVGGDRINIYTLLDNYTAFVPGQNVSSYVNSVLRFNSGTTGVTLQFYVASNFADASASTGWHDVALFQNIAGNNLSVSSLLYGNQLEAHPIALV